MAFLGPDIPRAVEVIVSSGVTDFSTFQIWFCFEDFEKKKFSTCFCFLDDTFDLESRGLNVVPLDFSIKTDETVRGEVFRTDVVLTLDFLGVGLTTFFFTTRLGELEGLLRILVGVKEF